MSTPSKEPEPVVTDSFEDGAGRHIRVTTYDGLSTGERDNLLSMYADWDPEDRTLGLPPREQAERAEWLDRLSDGLHALAWHDDRAVGHTGLSLKEEDAHELLAFVTPSYRNIGVGSMLLSVVLASHAERGGSRVRIRVERTNEPALGFFRKFGFVTTNEAGLAVEMVRDVRPVEYGPNCP